MYVATFGLLNNSILYMKQFPHGVKKGQPTPKPQRTYPKPYTLKCENVFSTATCIGLGGNFKSRR